MSTVLLERTQDPNQPNEETCGIKSAWVLNTAFLFFSLWIQILILYMFTNHKILLNFSVQSFYQGFITVA